MDPKPDLNQIKQRPFWQQFLFITGSDLLVTLAGSILLGTI